MTQKKNPCADGTCRTPTSQRLQVIDTPENGDDHWRVGRRFH